MTGDTTFEPLTYTTKELSDLLGIGVVTLRKMRKLGQGPSCVTLGDGSVRYLRTVVADWLAAGGDRKAASHE